MKTPHEQRQQQQQHITVDYMNQTKLDLLLKRSCFNME